VVIEDYQDEFKPQREGNKENGKIKFFLIALGIWFVIAVISYALFSKTIISNLESTNAVYTIKNISRLRKELNTRTETLCFMNLRSGEPKAVYVKEEVQKGGHSEYHDVLEGLLDGPEDKALADGNISLIAPGTKLEGFAKSQNLCYVCLSKEFLESENLISATEQINNTIQALDPKLKEIIILVDGKEISTKTGV